MWFILSIYNSISLLYFIPLHFFFAMQKISLSSKKIIRNKKQQQNLTFKNAIAIDCEKLKINFKENFLHFIITFNFYFNNVFSFNFFVFDFFTFCQRFVIREKKKIKTNWKDTFSALIWLLNIFFIIIYMAFMRIIFLIFTKARVYFRMGCFVFMRQQF